MILLEDTRNPVSKHQNIHDYCAENGIHIERTKLYVGDYTLPTNQRVCIDTKKDLVEVYGNVISDVARFKAELARARNANIRLIILVEQPGINSLFDVAQWKNPLSARWKKIHDAHKEGKMLNVTLPVAPHSSAVLAQRMQRLATRCGVEWQFCDKYDTGRVICEILEGVNAHE